MKRQNTLTISFIALILINFNANSETLSDNISACTAALDKGDFTAAVNNANNALKSDANHRETLLCKGRALGAQGDYEQALSAFLQAEKQSKTPFDGIITQLLLGNLHKKYQKNAEALASYSKSLKLCEAEKNDKFARINHNLMGETYAQNKDQNAVLASFEAGSKLAMNDNERAESFELLAGAYKTLGQYDRAIEYQVKAVQMQKISGTLDQYADANLALGQIQIAAKDYVNADKTLSKLAQFAKENGGAYYEAKADLYMAQSKVASGDVASAKTLLTEARILAKSVKANDLNTEIDLIEKQLK